MEWQKKTENEIMEILKTNRNGLKQEEANERIKKYGLNELPKAKKDNIFKIFFSEFNDPIIWLLIVSIIFSFIVGEVVDACAIIFIILVDAIVGTIQEWKASKSAEALQDLIKVQVKVLRDGKEQLIESNQLVIGDIVLLESGNKISADLRVIESRNLTVDESILTGESINVLKNTDIIEKNYSISDCKNMLFAGTSVITGRGVAIVCETAANTEIGKIADKVTKTDDTKSPLTIRMEKFSKQITVLIIIIAIIIAILLYNNGIELKDIFLSVIALSVSAMPEGLPLALTMALTIGSNRMAKKNVIVKKLNSVESLGSCTVIASDKTGTLTVNEQTAKKIVFPDGSIYDVEGTGYNDSGEIIPLNGESLENAIYISELGLLNNEAGLEKKKDKWSYYGDSIDVAFLALAKKAKLDSNNKKILGKIPYESENKYSAVFYEREDKIHCTIKGSLEKVFEFCDYMIVNSKRVKINKELITEQNEKLASDGFRVIALADGEVTKFENKEIYNEKDINKINFIGLVAFIDPIRVETIDSIKDCKTAGIKVVMVTGDHPLTAFAIAKQLGITNIITEVTNGEEVDKYLKKGQEAFDKFVNNKRVFTRVTPLQKLEIVESYKRQKEFVAVTGDGVNDAPAIKSANIGIAMGSGTDVAKETASMIIIDDNFLSIVDGIKEGRNAYNNIRKISYFLLSCGFAEVLFFILATIFKMEMPLVAIQLLWLNVVTDGLQDLALSFEKDTDDIMKEQPRNTKESLFDKLLMEEILISGIFIGVIVFGLWYYLINVVHMEVAHARGYIMALMVFIQNIHVLNCRSEKHSAFKMSFKSNPLVLFSILSAIGLQIIIMEVPLLSRILGTYSVSFVNMIYLFLLALPVLIVMEIFKIIKKDKKN
ncbi:MAG: HAD-IC family P-type ATPase [Bacilli bacterium]|nr:HAD-IC family P-type ATPase [Bacilli bacterium]